MNAANETLQKDESLTEFGLPFDRAFSRPATEESIQRTAEALRKHNFSVRVVDTAADARDLVRSLLPREGRIYTAPSETLRLSGIDDDINGSGAYVSVRSELAKLDPKTQRPEMRRLTATPDVVVGSVHAVTEDGRLVAASATGSQLGPYAAGAGKAIFVVGSQKIVPDLETALRRLQFYSYPKEDDRARAKYGSPTALAKILIMNLDRPAERSTVVLVREPIGF